VRFKLCFNITKNEKEALTFTAKRGMEKNRRMEHWMKDKNLLWLSITSTYFKNDVMQGLEDTFVKQPLDEMKYGLLKNASKRHTLTKENEKKCMIFATGVDSCWKLMVWTDILTHVFDDPVLKKLDWPSKCYFRSKDGSHDEVDNDMEPAVFISSKMTTDDNVNMETDALPLSLAWRYSHVEANVVLDYVIHRINTYIIGLNVNLCDYIIGWDMNREEFSFFDYTMGHSCEVKRNSAKKDKEAVSSSPSFVDTLFPNDDNDRHFLFKIKQMTLLKHEALITHLKRLETHMKSIVFLSFLLTLGFQEVNKESEKCKERVLLLRSLLQQETL
jgi:hypothetical protein